MKKYGTFLLAIVICINFALPVWADILELKDGTLITGSYMGGTQNTVRFESDGKLTVYPVADILAVTFTLGASDLSQEPESSEKPQEPAVSLKIQQPKLAESDKTGTSQPPQTGLVLAEGTRIPVSISDSLDVRHNKKDDWFKGVLHKDLVIDGKVVAPKGSLVHGQVVQAEQTASTETIALALRELVVDNKIIPIVTAHYVVQGKSRNVIDLGDLAKNSLKVVTRKREYQVPQQSLIEFEITKPVELGRYLRQ